MKVWANGALLPGSGFHVSALDRGVTLGDGVFETLRVWDGVAIRFDRHMERFMAGAAFLGIPFPWTVQSVLTAVQDVLAANALPEAAIRITLTRGVAKRGLLPTEPCAPTLLITPAPLLPPLPPARAIIATITCRNEHSPVSRIKSLSYLDAILARQEAARHEADEALLMNTSGRLAEATVSTVFILHEGRLITPTVEEGALPGIARGIVCERLDVFQQPIARALLQNAQEIVLTNSLGVRAVISLNAQPVGKGQPGAAYTAIKAVL